MLLFLTLKCLTRLLEGSATIKAIELYLCLYLEVFSLVITVFPSSAATHCTYFNWSVVINKAKRLWWRDIWLISHYKWNKCVTAVGGSIIDGVMVDPWTRPEARSGECLWTVSLTEFISKSGWPFSHVWPYTHCLALQLLQIFLEFIHRSSDAWKPFLTSTVPFSSILSLENRTVAKEKEVRRTIHSFILQTQTHADPYQRKNLTQLSSDFICRAMQLDTPTRALFW